ncbi:MAG TPA: phage tail sheath C-terminal domain-containing protein [Candidatus Angelobacter sp.]|jgi:phage tail sheath protein FI|nr:phage tail sheath C-terminal domain-containing protein [Candidatus Angelobacter sp.]
MAEYLHPGVFVEEVSSGVRPIEGVGTSTAAFIGTTAKGVPNKATFITSWAQFTRAFGDLVPSSYLPYAVSQFFNTGGKRCYIVRALNVVSSTPATRDLPDRETTSPRNSLRITANGAGAWGNGLLVTVQDSTSNPTTEFKLVIAQDDPANIVELFDNLSMDPNSADYVETAINGVSDYITVKDLGASEAAGFAQGVTTNALADPVPFAGGGEAVTLETPDGTVTTVNFTGNVARATVLSQLNTAWAAFNVTASLDPSNKLVVKSGSAGFDKYIILGGAATGAGRPLAGLAGFAQGSGAAIGSTMKSASAATFDTTGGNNVLTITVHGDAVPNINLTAGAAVTAATIVNDINTALAGASNAHGLVSAHAEGNRVVITTTNEGAADSTLALTGTGATQLQFKTISGGAPNGPGQGRSEAAFVQSAQGPFALADGSNFTITLNNGTLADPATNVVITVNLGTSNISNLAQATATEIANAINTASTAAGQGNIASVVANRVVIRQNRKGNFYTLQVQDGLKSPNIRLKFDTSRRSGYVEGDTASPYLRPASNLDASGVIQPWVLQNGDDGPPISNTDLIGTADLKTGLHALDDVTDVNFVTIPGASDPGVISQAVGYCTVRRDCFFIADSPGKNTKDTPVTDPSHVSDFLSNKVTTKTSYGGFYYPWLLINDPVGAGKNPTRYVPPSGFIAGMYAFIDNTRGVWKAPAGTEANLSGPLALEYSVTDSEQDILNPIGVNCIRQFPASGIVVWGARTMGTLSDPEWRYIPVRRYAIYLEQSILRGTQWAVFEPNDERLWASLKANIEDFLMGEFRKGALAGSTPQQAFSVKCDADLNPPSEVNAGRVNMEVKFAPLKPAEFVIIRISQKVQVPGQ